MIQSAISHQNLPSIFIANPASLTELSSNSKQLSQPASCHNSIYRYHYGDIITSNNAYVL